MVGQRLAGQQPPLVCEGVFECKAFWVLEKCSPFRVFCGDASTKLDVIQPHRSITTSHACGSSSGELQIKQASSYRDASTIIPQIQE